MLPQGGRVTCYPGARASHVTPGKAKQRKAKQRQAKQSQAKQKQSKSNCGATRCHMLPQGARATCYPGARVPHVTPGKDKQRKAKQRQAKQMKAEAKQIKL